jgi:hypothetical protein
MTIGEKTIHCEREVMTFSPNNEMKNLSFKSKANVISLK